MIAEISIGDDELDFTEGTFTVDSSYVAGKSSDSQQPAGTYCMRENDSLTQVAAQDLSGADAVLAAFESFCIEELSMPKDEEAKHIMKIDDIAKSSSLSDDKTKDALKVNNSIQSCIVNNDEGNTVMKVDDTSETNGPAMTSSSPCRQSSFKNKLEQASQNKRPVRNCRKKASKKVLLDLSTLQIIRRQRSSLCKRARSNVWGLLGNIASLSEHNGGLDIVADNTKRSRRPRGVQENGKRRKKMTVRSSEKLKLDKNMTVRSSEQSKQKRHTPTGLITLKVKFGKETAGTMGTIPAIENKENDCGVKNPLHGLPNGAQGLLEDEVPQSVQFQSTCGNSENASGVHLPFKNTSGNLDRNTSDDLCDSPFYGKVAKVGATNSRVLDSGTSPDSEVINILPGSQISRKDSEELHHVLISSNGFAVSRNVSGLSLPWKGSEQERRKDELHKTDDCCLEAELRGPGILNKVQEFAKLGQRENMGDGSYSSNTSTSASTGNASVHTSNMEVFSGEPLPSAWVEFGNCYGTSKVENGTEANLSPGLDEQRESMESLLSQKLLPCSKGQKLNKSSRARKVTKSKSETPNLSRSEKHSKKKGNEDESKSKNEEMGVSDQTLQDAENLPEFRNHTLLVIGEAGETGKEDISLKPDVFINNIVADEVAEEWIPPRNAWVSCDDCHKWRRIPAALADKIEETNCRWVCKDNKDRKFAECSIPQEKSNAEINAELEISDASCEEDACDVRLTSNEPRRNQSRVSKQSPWTLIKSNLFLHRRRKTQTIDEIMVCGCKQPLDGRMGCGSKCLNSMLNIECIPGTCPCGESCSNQQFQKRRYAKLKSFECGKKGYGLQLLEDVSEGQFLIEYVGEVLDMQSYEARQREYAIKGHKHFYFMTLNGSEVIDACDKGNLGRFINHSCDPNCRTEKWMVNGEVCIGIFALRDIKKSEEVTFDYNYVRVFGAAAKKCVCGSSQCRGYIGGDPVNSDAIVQGDSDEEYPELVMACEDDEMDQNTNNLASMTSYHNDKEVRISKESSKHMSKISVTLCNDRQAETSLEKQRKEIVFRDKVGIDSSTNAVGCFAIMKESRQSMNASASIPLKIKMSLENECSVGQHSPSLQSGDVTSRDLFAAPEECSAAEESMENSLCLNQGSNTISLNIESEKLSTDREDTKRALKPSAGENEAVLSKFHPRTKISGKFSDKKRKPKADALNVKKQLEIENNSHVVPPKHKRLLEYPSNGRFEAGRFEAVQEKLNELLDSDGGISKRKDASRGYLKLLLLTAASGDSGDGEAIQSNRDLSMILDALLKTKSRTVLVDIINKNGLQMLHNIMKRYRKEFIKIPILRKLLKVLEYLATREILNSEHINGGPRCHGVESFRDSILTLTEHMDKQVHQIARNFRDRWIPRCFRKYGSMDRDDCRMEFYRGPNHDRFSALHNNSSDQWAKTSETLDCGTTSVAASSTIDTGKPEGSSASRNIRKRKSRWDQPYKGRPGLVAETNMAGDGANNMDEDVPPGFSSPRTCPMPLSDTSSSAIDHKKKGSSHQKSPSQVAMGLSQKRFISRSSVAYGVPISIVQQFGTYLSETSESWIVAPGMPFQPFPPLPQYPREQSKCTSSQVAKRAEQNFHNHATPDLSQNPPTPSAVSAPDLESPGAINQFDFQRVRSHNNLGRKYFRQQKWNNSKLAPPWVRMRNGWGLSGTNSRNGMCPPGFGSGLNESRNSYNSQDISPGVQNGNFFHHHPQPQNWN